MFELTTHSCWCFLASHNAGVICYESWCSYSACFMMWVLIALGSRRMRSKTLAVKRQHIRGTFCMLKYYGLKPRRCREPSGRREDVGALRMKLCKMEAELLKLHNDRTSLVPKLSIQQQRHATVLNELLSLHYTRNGTDHGLSCRRCQPDGFGDVCFGACVVLCCVFTAGRQWLST